MGNVKETKKKKKKRKSNVNRERNRDKNKRVPAKENGKSARRTRQERKENTLGLSDENVTARSSPLIESLQIKDKYCSLLVPTVFVWMSVCTKKADDKTRISWMRRPFQSPRRECCSLCLFLLLAEDRIRKIMEHGQSPCETKQRDILAGNCTNSQRVGAPRNSVEACKNQRNPSVVNFILCKISDDI